MTAVEAAVDDAQAHALVVRTVAELGSLTRAARVLGSNVQAVSMAVRRLETATGVQMLVREGSVLRATAAGARHLSGARDAVATPTDDLRPTELMIDVCAAELRGTVLAALPCFAAFNAGIRVQLRSSAARLDPWPAPLDAALRLGDAWLACHGATVLGAYPQVMCASRPYLARHGLPRRPADLASHAVARSLRGTDGALEPLPFATTADATQGGPDAALATDDADVRLAAAIDGYAIAILPLNPLVRAALSRGKLVRVLPDQPLRRQPIVLLQSSSVAPELARFVAWLRSLYASESRDGRAAEDLARFGR